MYRPFAFAVSVTILLAAFPSSTISSEAEVVAWATQQPAAPGLTVSGGTEKQRALLADALRRFQGAGLTLPDLEVVFSDDSSVCNGAIGYFSPAFTPWRVSICNRHVTSVYLHELAHAWTRANLDNSTRSAFEDLRGLSNWNDRDQPWKERAFEVAANVIAAGLSDRADPPTEHGIETRLAGFTLLTGITAPRLESVS